MHGVDVGSVELREGGPVVLGALDQLPFRILIRRRPVDNGTRHAVGYDEESDLAAANARPRARPGSGAAATLRDMEEGRAITELTTVGARRSCRADAQRRRGRDPTTLEPCWNRWPYGTGMKDPAEWAIDLFDASSPTTTKL